jgi:hypothetical protein
MYGHQEKSVGEKEELCPGEPRHNSGIGKGDALVSSWVQEGLQNNETCCYSKEKVSKTKEAHTVPPPVAQTNHLPPIPLPTRSETRSNPPCSHQTAAPSAQPCSFKVNNRCSNTNTETERKRANSGRVPGWAAYTKGGLGDRTRK